MVGEGSGWDPRVRAAAVSAAVSGDPGSGKPESNKNMKKTRFLDWACSAQNVLNVLISGEKTPGRCLCNFRQFVDGPGHGQK